MPKDEKALPKRLSAGHKPPPASAPTAANLFELINSNDAKELEATLHINKAIDLLATARDAAGNSPVHVAVMAGHEAVLRELLDAGAKLWLTKSSEDGTTPLHAAMGPPGGQLQDNRDRCLDLLLQRGGDDLVNERDTIGQTPVFLAARFGNAHALNLLLATGHADVDAVNTSSGMSPLFRACEEGHADCVKILIEAKADVDLVEPGAGRSPAFVCAQFERVECLETLIQDSDADLHLTNKNGRSPIHIARALQNVGCASTLALATLDYDYHGGENPNFIPVPTKWEGLTKKGPPALTHLTSSVQELQATVEGSKIITSLPYAFARRPLDTCYAVVALVVGYRRMQRKVMSVDERAAENLLEAAFIVQQALLSMLDTLDEREFHNLVLPPDKDTGLDAAVAAECKLFLSYPRLQTLLQDYWGFVTPSEIAEHAEISWYGQSDPGRWDAPTGRRARTARKASR